MRILITGNMGYVGPSVVQQFRESSPHAVLVGFDTGYFGACINGAEVLPEARVNAQFFGDVRSFDPCLLERVDAIVHLAGISNDPVGSQFERVTLQTNHEATIKLAREAKKAGVGSFVFASSCSIYGTSDDGPRTEESPVNPLTAYARSKVLAEHDLGELADDRFAVTCLRFSTACGWSDRLRLDLVLNDFVASAVAARKITILSDGTPWRPLINVRDMALAAEWAVQRDTREGGNYVIVNVGSDDRNYQVRELAEAVAADIPGVEISVNENAAPDKRSYRVSFALFRELAPKHQPRVDLGASIRELKSGLEVMNFRDRDFRNSKFIRLKVLTDLRRLGHLDDQLRWNRVR